MSARVLALSLSLLSVAATPPPGIPFKPQMLDGGASETAAVADFNRDGRLDIVSGDSWYEAPRWTKRTFRELDFSNNYIDNFSDLPVDVDGDGFTDIASVTWFAGRSRGSGILARAAGRGSRRRSIPGFNVEFAILADINNDGRAHEILAQENGTGQAWYEVKDKGWAKHVVSDRSYGHGIGAGDVNKDGRTDILTPRGWLEAPADPARRELDVSRGLGVRRTWRLRRQPKPEPVPQPGCRHASPRSGSCTCSTSTATAATTSSPPPAMTSASSGSNRARARSGPGAMIDGAWSQGHASTLADLNGDGRLDLVTGKRFMAHNGIAIPENASRSASYWYESETKSTCGRRQAGPGVEWIRHVVDYGGRMGVRHADTGDRYRRRRGCRYRVSRQERAVPRREPHEKVPGVRGSR